MIPEPLIEYIREASHLLLTTHMRPDGDAMGSLFGLAQILEDRGQKVFCYLDEPLSPLWEFLPQPSQVSDDLVRAMDFAAAARTAGHKLVAIALDCGDAERLGHAKEQLLTLSPFLVIDHHSGHRSFGDHLWLEAESSSTGELVYELSRALEAPVSRDAALCLYVALVTDSGSFRYQCTRPRTLRIAADLVERGVCPAEVAEEIFDNHTVAGLKLLELVLATLELSGHGEIALIHVSEAMFGKSGGTTDDCEGFINYPRAIDSVKVAVFIKETAEGKISVSLRANGEVDVAEVAGAFGGGGHKNAAGFRAPGLSVGEVAAKLLPALQAALA